jgi:hypothetical protein
VRVSREKHDTEALRAVALLAVTGFAAPFGTEPFDLKIVAVHINVDQSTH